MKMEQDQYMTLRYFHGPLPDGKPFIEGQRAIPAALNEFRLLRIIST